MPILSVTSLYFLGTLALSAVAFGRDEFFGFDQTGARGAGATGPTAWIYKGTLTSFPKKEGTP
jgi:hypothetical protein